MKYKKYTKIDWKILPWRVQNRGKSKSGEVLGSSWNKLRFWAASGRHLGVILAPSWCHLGAISAPKSNKNLLKGRLKIDWFFESVSKMNFVDFKTILVPKTSPKWGLWGCFFLHCCRSAKVWFWTTVHQKNLIFHLREGIFSLFWELFSTCFPKTLPRRSLESFREDFWTNLASKRPPKIVKNRFESQQFLISFFAQN